MPPETQAEARARDDLLSRLDERTERIERDIADLKINYVTKTELAPIKAIVFGGVALVLIGFMGALIVVAGLKS